MGNVGLRRDQLHNLWGSRQKENAEPLCLEITMKGIITNFRLTQQSIKPSPLSMELCVTAQAAAPGAAWHLPAASLPSPQPAVWEGGETPPWPAMLPGCLGKVRKGEARSAWTGQEKAAGGTP